MMPAAGFVVVISRASAILDQVQRNPQLSPPGLIVKMAAICWPESMIAATAIDLPEGRIPIPERENRHAIGASAHLLFAAT